MLQVVEHARSLGRPRFDYRAPTARMSNRLNNLAVIRRNAGESAEAKAIWSRALSIPEDDVATSS